MALLKRIQEFGAAGMTRGQMMAERAMKKAYLSDKLSSLRRAGLIAEQPHASGQGADMSVCLVWAAEFAPAVIEPYQHVLAERSRYCPKVAELLSKAGASGVIGADVVSALGIAVTTAQQRLQWMAEHGHAVVQRLGVSRGHSQRIYYAPGMEPTTASVRALKVRPDVMRKRETSKAAAGPAIIPDGLRVTVCPAFDGDRWKATAPAVSRLDPDDCRPWARACT